MGNEEDCGLQVPAGFFYEVKNLGLHCHVQGGGGLVGNEKLGMAGKGNGYHDTLPHAAGQFIGIAGNHILRVPYMHLFQQGDSFLECFFL